MAKSKSGINTFTIILLGMFILMFILVLVTDMGEWLNGVKQ